MRVRNEYPDFAAISDEFVEPLFSCEIDQGNCAWHDDAFPILHELDVEKNFLAIALAQQPELFHAVSWRKTGLDICPAWISLHRPQRSVIPCVITQQRLRPRSRVCTSEGDFPTSLLGSSTQ